MSRITCDIVLATWFDISSASIAMPAIDWSNVSNVKLILKFWNDKNLNYCKNITNREILKYMIGWGKKKKTWPGRKLSNLWINMTHEVT